MHDLHKITPKFLIEGCIEMSNGSLIYKPESVKSLGVHFDNHFEFKKRIDMIKRDSQDQSDETNGGTNMKSF